MKITFMHEGAIQEFTPPDYATTVTIKTRPNGVSIDYESSTVDAVKDYFDRPPKEINSPIVERPVKLPAGRERPRKLSAKERDAVVKAWTKERPVPSYEALGKRFGVHRTTIGDIISEALDKPTRAKKTAAKKLPRNTGRRPWSTKRVPDETRQQVLDLWNTGQFETATDVSKQVGISLTTVKRILNNAGVVLKKGGPRNPTGRKGALSPFQEDEIMRLVEEGSLVRKAIADKFKVNLSTVNRVLAKKRAEKENNFQNSLEEQPVTE